MRREKGNQRQGDMVTASEIACWAYCPEQWRLQNGLRLEPSNQTELAAGDRNHARKAVAECVAGGSITLGRILAVVAALVLLRLLWRWS